KVLIVAPRVLPQHRSWTRRYPNRKLLGGGPHGNRQASPAPTVFKVHSSSEESAKMGRIPADDFVGRRVTKTQQKRCEQSNTFALVRTSIRQSASRMQRPDIRRHRH